jgi:hypothetical protein
VARGWKKLHNREIRDLHSTPVIYKDDMSGHCGTGGRGEMRQGF